MCGIIGCIADNALPILMEGLRRLEYRGYDSAGVAILSPSGDLHPVKAVGPLKNLESKIAFYPYPIDGEVGIGHTRWATNGAPSLENAHPHLSEDGSVCLVHNGIIENAWDIREHLLKNGASFYGDTDSEVLANLIAEKLKDDASDPLIAIHKSLKEVKGSYALAVLFPTDPGHIYAARKDSSLIASIGETGNLYLASDPSAIPSDASDTFIMEDGEYAVLSKGNGIAFYDSSLKRIEKETFPIFRDESDIGHAPYKDYMEKEISEEPEIYRRTLESLKDDFFPFGLDEKTLRNFDSIILCGCGSAYNVGLSGSYIIESLARLPARAEMASEFRYRNPALSKNSLFVAISQSGETADTLAALRMAKERGLKTLAVVNVPGSAIARETDFLFLTPAGKEVSVVTTKAYEAQLLTLMIFAISLAKARGIISKEDANDRLSALCDLPSETQSIIDRSDEIASLAKEIYTASNLFYIGRALDCASVLEGSLKLKEVSYIHSEAFPAGELKHCAMALIEEGTPVIGLASDEITKGKTLSNLFEAKSRGAKVYLISPFEENNLDGYFRLPESHPSLYPFLSMTVMQLLALYAARFRKLDVDKPRNLAKSVTVE